MFKKLSFNSLLIIMMFNAGALNGSSMPQAQTTQNYCSASSSNKLGGILWGVGSGAAAVGATLISPPALIFTAASTSVLAVGYGYYWWKNSIISAELRPMEQRVRATINQLGSDLRAEMARSAQGLAAEIRSSEQRQMQHGDEQLQLLRGNIIQHIDTTGNSLGQRIDSGSRAFTAQLRASQQSQMQHTAELKGNLMDHIDRTNGITQKNINQHIDSSMIPLRTDIAHLTISVDQLAKVVAGRDASTSSSQPHAASPAGMRNSPSKGTAAHRASQQAHPFKGYTLSMACLAVSAFNASSSESAAASSPAASSSASSSESK